MCGQLVGVRGANRRSGVSQSAGAGAQREIDIAQWRRRDGSVRFTVNGIRARPTLEFETSGEPATHAGAVGVERGRLSQQPDREARPGP